MHERDILLATLELVGPDEREAFLAQVCGDDVQLRSRVDALLRATEVQDSFLEAPAVETELLGRETDAVRQASAGDAELSLDFLHPSDEPQALGRLGPYTITEVIGRGGMGIVLKARDPKLNRIVAIKVLAPELATNPTARKRFQREAHAAAAVVHQHVVTIHAVDEDRVPYLVMEFVDGQSLKEKIDREGHLKLVEILRIGQQAAAGLAAAHAHGMMHRDVKPANILLENGIERVRITDFGLARAVDDVGITRTGEVAGTPEYMSPEQAQGLPMDGRSDLFSFGCVLYAMCTGRPPFRAETAFATARRVCEDTPRNVREVNPEIPQWLVAIIDRLLAKQPDERFQTAAEVAGLLGQRLAELQHPSLVHAAETNLPRSQIPNPNSQIRFGRWPLAAIAAALVLLLAVTLTEATGVTHFAPTLIRIVTGEGALLVEVNDPAVKVTVEGDGGLKIRGAGLEEIRLRPGNYKVHADRDGKPITLDRELVSISKGGREVLRVKLASGLPAAMAGSEKGAFVVLGGQGIAERKFDTLAEAVQSASDGDTIEIRGDGPFTTERISIERALTIRAGERFRPVLALSAETVATDDEDCLLLNVAPLVLEGLEFRRINSTQKGLHEFHWQNVVRALGPLHAANCRFVTRKTHAAVSPNSAICELQNCEVYCAEAACAMMADLQPNERLIVHNCLLSGPLSTLHWRVPVSQASFQVTRTTFCSPAIEFLCRRDSETNDVSEAGKVVRIEVRDSIFPGSPVFLFAQEFPEKILSPSDAAVFLRNAIAWKGEKNLYAAAGSFLDERTAKGVQNPENPITTLLGWSQFWGTTENGSIEGSVRFAGGNLSERVHRSPTQVTPADFHLREDSAGYRAGPDGKDLGADLDLVGPGAAYERWKKTPEYRQWLKETGQLKEAVANSEPLRLVRRFEENDAAWINGIQFDPESDRTVVTSASHGLDVWDLESGTHTSRISMLEAPWAFGFFANGTRLFCVTYQGKLVILEWPSGKVLLEKPAHKSVGTAVVLLSHSRLATSGHDGIVRIWDATTGEQLQELLPINPAAPGQNYCLAFAPAEQCLVAGGPWRVNTWNLNDLKAPRNIGIHRSSVYAVAISPDSRYVLTGGTTGLVQLFELMTGKLVRRFDKHTAPVGSVVFLSDGRHFVSGAMDGTLRVWSFDGQEVARHVSSKNDVSKLAVTSDGHYVLTAGTQIAGKSTTLPRDATLQLWELPPSVWPMAAKATLKQ